ncbi:MAG: NAD(P)-dependent alcohol dehydrogenase [Chloroflexi bacterium]|nr:NAD(P)-dependent alcohol dehydrogenase [Chloroflexota bacterium]
MRAVVYESYGSPDVLRLAEVATPAPRQDEVRVKIVTTTVTIGDTVMRSLRIPGPRLQRLFARAYLGIRKPKRPVLGMEVAGVIDAVGRDVTRFKVSDAVLASTFGVNFGGYAEYKCFPQDGIILKKPAKISFEQAAAIPGAGMTALRCLRKGSIKPGQSVLIYGASGAVGTYAVQIAKHFGATVTGVCSTANLDLVRSLGAETVIDYTQPGFALPERAFNVVFDAVDKLQPALAKRALKHGGTYLNVLTDSDGPERLEELDAIVDLVEAGAVRPVIDRCYPLEQIVEAHRYVDTGRKKGNVVITVSRSSEAEN